MEIRGCRMSESQSIHHRIGHRDSVHGCRDGCIHIPGSCPERSVSMVRGRVWDGFAGRSCSVVLREIDERSEHGFSFGS